MTRSQRRSAPRRRRLSLIVLTVVPVLVAAVLLGGPSHTVGSAAGASAAGETVPQTDSAVPARGVFMLGSSPGEAPGETWGIGELGASEGRSSWAIVRYAAGAGWSVAPGPLDSEGHQLAGFAPDRSVLAGSVTAAGSAALLGTVTPPASSEEHSAVRQVLLARDHGGTFREAQAVPSALLPSGEKLFSNSRSPLVAALDEPGGRGGALVVPVQANANGPENTVLHWDGAHWTSEPIEGLPPASEEFRVLAIGASSGAAWLLAQLSATSQTVALYSRHAGGEGEAATWRPVAMTAGQVAAEPQALRVPVTGEPGGEPFTVSGLGGPPSSRTQLLTVDTEGLWIDGERADTHTPLTMYFKAHDGQSGELTASWCSVGSGAPPCTHALVEEGPGGPSTETLPTGAGRSFAWADASSPYGQRVITGLTEGVSLRLEGASFRRVLSLGGFQPDVGGSLGAAFSEPREGWLGSLLLPVHLTMSPSPSRMTPYPVPFRHALTAVAPQPGVPVGALGSEALAVGDQGEVARYVPGEGWMPESLLSAGGRRATPRLRAVAWPTPNRAFAVGQEGQMWLWRGETGLWEQDPATPLNFDGDLLGIAFDPSEPSRGYAVGQAGVLLAYGKSWAQEALPAEVTNASFTSVAFAGSEALAPFRVPHFQTLHEGAHYTGGLLVNEGAGWHVDTQAAAALEGAIPWAVAGLPDGGAAISAEAPGGRPVILEREAPGAPWRPTAVPYSGVEIPSALGLFREGGALRVVGVGNAPQTLLLDTDERPPPEGFPPNLVRPYPLSSGYVLRQTAVGWSDEQHERNSAQDPAGEYRNYDMVFQPDPSAAVLIDPTGSSGWIVGGWTSTGAGGEQTADVARYPADGVAPPGSTAPIPVEGAGTAAALAIGGNAGCLAPCADRANARVGPDVWLSSALRVAAGVSGVRAFLYTGPRVTNGQGAGEFPVEYGREFGRYAQVLGSSSIPAFAAPSSTDRGPGSECAFQSAFAGFPEPFGSGPAAPGISSAGRSAEACGPESQSDYYALRSTGPGGVNPVRVLMLDTSVDPGATQLSWVTGQLAAARAASEPVVAVGNVDLNAQIAAGDAAAARLAQTLVAGGASAYFYDSPQENVEVPLRSGAESIPAFGSGTLGYISSVAAAKQDFHGHSGFLLAEVDFSHRDPRTNRAPVTAQLIPVIGQLAMEAKDGVLLRRSQAALFSALARRPLAGGESQRQANTNNSALYIPLPAQCVGGECAKGIFPQYSFSSSRPDIGDFVAPNTASPDPHAVLLGPEEKPVPDSASGLFCAYNKGETTVTISAGGLSSSLKVVVQAGSVRRPCGTTRLKELPAETTATPPAPAPAPAPSGTPAALAPLVPVPPPPAAPVSPPAPPAPKPAVPFLLPPAAQVSALLPFVPLPVPTPARPTPPSGTSAVTSPAQAPEKEEEKEEAPESVSNKAVAYRSAENEPMPAYLLGLLVLAALAGASARRRPRRGRREVRVAPATVNTARGQRRMSRSGRRPW